MLSKYVLFYLLVVVTALSQSLSYKAFITTSKKTISSTGEFVISYNISKFEGQLYVGFASNIALEVVGNDRLKVVVLRGESREVKFRVRCKEDFLRANPLQDLNFGVVVSKTPFIGAINTTENMTMGFVRLRDYPKLRQKLLRPKKHNSEKIAQDSVVIKKRSELMPPLPPIIPDSSEPLQDSDIPKRKKDSTNI